MSSPSWYQPHRTEAKSQPHATSSISILEGARHGKKNKGLHGSWPYPTSNTLGQRPYSPRPGRGGPDRLGPGRDGTGRSERKLEASSTQTYVHQYPGMCSGGGPKRSSMSSSFVSAPAPLFPSPLSQTRTYVSKTHGEKAAGVGGGGIECLER